MKKEEINILVVDDDANFRKSMTEAIKRFGYKATVAAKPEEAINLVKIKEFHAALVDCMLPKQSGVDLAVDMRKSRFGSAPLILISGVFRDKSFATEAQEKAGAIQFLNKPLDIEALKKKFEEIFSELLSVENVPLQVLVSKPFSSARERTKVIEGLEEVRGFDLPFLLSVLMDASASGHLNIATNEGEIFGVTLKKGKIVNVDSSESEATLLMILLEEGYVTKEDLKSIREQVRRGDLLACLIEQQFVSPHILPSVRTQQIFTELKRLFVDNLVNINFVPERSKEEPDFGLDLEHLTPLLHDVVMEVMTEDYLKSFYEQWLEYPIQVAAGFSENHTLFQSSLLKALPRLSELLPTGLTMEELLAKGKYSSGAFYKALHLMAIRRLIIFDDVKKVKGLAEYGDRMKVLFKELKGRNPYQVFAYFGVQEGAKSDEYEKIYREFAKANHPDRLPPSTAQDLRQIVNQVFSIVSEAHTVLSNPEKRSAFENDLKQKDAERQIHAEALAEEAYNYLKRGRVSEALQRTKEAMKLFGSRNVKIAHVWALMKSPGAADNSAEAARVLDSIPHEERRNAQYLFVSGLLKRNLGDTQGAQNQFDKAISLDPNFLEARREKSILGETTGKTEGFNADLTKLVGNFFKKR